MSSETLQEPKTKEKMLRLDDVPSLGILEEAMRMRQGAAKLPDATPRKARLAEHVVFLLPGLLGFESVSTFNYFADRVVAALRAGLERAWGAPVPVIPVPVPPTASLRKRQKRLVRTIADRIHDLEHGHQQVWVHLVGHSTGGVDANLLTAAEPLGGGDWRDLDPRAPALRARIRTVVSIASPHQGACIAGDPVARFLSDRDASGLVPLAGLCARFVFSAASDVEVSDFLSSAARETGKTGRFLAHVLARWELLGDLQPSRAPASSKLDSNVRRRSFITIAGKPKAGATSTPPADALFRDLSERASGWRNGTAEEGELIRPSIARLSEALLPGTADALLIKSPGTELPSQLDAGHNDGVVNTARQLIDPVNPDELAGIVVADHFDVVGYYDRHVFRVDRDGEGESRLMRAGLLHSGSGFRDDEFFELYQRVAAAIAI